MKRCSYCGSEADDRASYCGNCGARLEDKTYEESVDSVFSSATAAPEKTHIGIAIISFIFPLVGGILYLCWSEKEKAKASSAVLGLFAWLCYNVPVAGLVFYLVWRDSNPRYAKIGGIAAIAGVVMSVVSLLLQPLIGAYFTSAFAEFLGEIMGYEEYSAMLTLPLL